MCVYIYIYIYIYIYLQPARSLSLSLHTPKDQPGCLLWGSTVCAMIKAYPSFVELLAMLSLRSSERLWLRPPSFLCATCGAFWISIVRFWASEGSTQAQY